MKRRASRMNTLLLQFSNFVPQINSSNCPIVLAVASYKSETQEELQSLKKD